MRALAAIAVFLFFAAVIEPQVSAPPRAQEFQQEGFSLYVHAFLDTDRKPTVAVNVEIPYTSLIFLKRAGVFQSDYAIYIKVLDKKKQLLETAVITESVTVDEYEATRSARTAAKAEKQFRLDPGDYFIRCAVEVKNTLRVFEKGTAVTVPQFLEAGIGVGTPRLFAVEIDTSVSLPVLARADSSRAGEWKPQEDTLFAELAKYPLFQFDVYVDEVTRDSLECRLYFEVVDDKKNLRAYGQRNARIAGTQNRFIVCVDTDEWDPGSYVFHAKVVQSDPIRERVSNLRFVLGYTRAMLTRGFDKTLSIISLIGSKEEIEEFSRAPESERPRLWAAFWERRDPSPGSGGNEALREHVRRVQYAIDNLSDGSSGWQSDRGKVYITYGEPEHTEMKMNPEYPGQYLIWYYYEKNLRFVFYDRSGLGEYRLTDTSQL